MTTASDLYIDPTPAYQPVLNDLNAQKRSTLNRYETNKGDIKNIFGDLTSLTEKDSVRIADQYTKTIAEQRAGVAARTAEVRTSTAATVDQGAAAGEQRGGGPAMNVNPVQVAAEQGIAQSNAYQTTWEALMNANQMQAQADISARGAGYGQQELGALKQLQQNLEDRLAQIGSSRAQVQSDIAQARIQGRQNVRNARYQETQDTKSYNRQLSLAAASRSEPTVQPTVYSNDYTGTISYIEDTYGLGGRAGAGIDAIDAKNYKTWNEAYTAWNKSYGAVRAKDGSLVPYPQDVKSRVKLYFQQNYNNPRQPSTSSVLPGSTLYPVQ